jgi:hypothetical protein
METRAQAMSSTPRRERSPSRGMRAAECLGSCFALVGLQTTHHPVTVVSNTKLPARVGRSSIMISSP